MKQLIMLMLAFTVVLGACGKKEETTAPKVEVKVNKADEAKKKIAAAKKRGEKKDTTETTTTEDKFSTDKYNKARACLLGDGECDQLVNTEEYSRAWNNLTNEGYVCQNGSCKAQQNATTEVQTEAPTTESVPVTEAPQTETVATEAPIEVQTEAPLAP